ncbi:MAG: hypothetical protein H6760_04910 [Candidatus Nomurabacteria bacterium]|nr:MAG: hypothetical protein H6760_04910 [Candidatus Nomurabacteria bacterium]
MRAKYFLGALILTFGIVALAWYVGDPVQSVGAEDKQTKEAISRGLDFLAQSHHPYTFDDAYLQYLYPDENLSCPLPNCQLSYRLLDAYFAVAMLRDRLSAKEKQSIQDVLEEQEAVFEILLPTWRTAPIEGTLRSEAASSESVALDTYCLLGYLTKDKAMAEHALEYLSPSGEWFAADHFTSDQWRNIADETWCIRLLAVTETYPEQFANMVETKTIEVRGFLQSQKPVAEKIAAVYHVLLMIQEPGITQSAEQIPVLQETAAALIASASTQLDAVTMANSLEMLTLSHFSTDSYVSGLREGLLRSQSTDGAWRYGDDNQYAVFATLRSLLGLTSDRVE